MASIGDNTSSYGTGEMAYDLRARYATIIGDILEEIALARAAEDYPRLYSFLDYLHTEINQKLSEKERKEYKTKQDACIKIINANKAEYLGTSKDAGKRNNIYAALKELELWLKDKMEKHKMFGAKADQEGL